MATRYRIKRKDQWGEVCYVVDGERIWHGDQARGMADFIIEQDPHNSDCSYVKRENTYGEKLYYLQPNPHGEGILVREKDAWGTVLFFVEGSRWSSEALLVRKDNQHGAVAWYVEPCDSAGGSGSSYREPTALDCHISKVHARALDGLSGIKRRYGTGGIVAVALLWVALITIIFVFVLDLGFLGMLLYGALIMGGILFIASRAV